MEVPQNVEIHHGDNSDWWIDGQGIVCTISKPNPVPVPRDKAMESLALLKSHTGDKKVCMLMDITHSRPAGGPREDQEYIVEELAKIVKAMAIITTTPLGKMMINLFFNLRPPRYPAKMFTNEQEAREWLKQYLA